MQRKDCQCWVERRWEEAEWEWERAERQGEKMKERPSRRMWWVRERACVTERGRGEVCVGRPCLLPPSSLPASPLPLSSPSLRQQQLKCRLCSSSSALLSLLLGHLSFLTTRGNVCLSLSLSLVAFFYPSHPFFSFFLSLAWSPDQSYFGEVFFYKAIAPWRCLETGGQR